MKRAWFRIVSLFLGILFFIFPQFPRAKESGGVRSTSGRTSSHRFTIEDSPTITIRISFQVGSADDPASMAGLTQLTARYLLEETKTQNPQIFAMGASLQAQAGKDQVTLVIRAHRDQVDNVLPIAYHLADRPAQNPALFNQLRQESLHALKQLQSGDTEAVGKEWLQSLLYKNHPYQTPPVGTQKGLQAATLPALMKHYETHFCSQRMLVAAAGPLSKNHIAQLQSKLGALNIATCTEAKPLPAAAVPLKNTLTILNHPAATSAGIHFGWALNMNRSHPDYPALLLASAYLGQHRQFNGILMQKVRVERGLTYGAYAYAEHFTQDGESRFPLPNTARRQHYFSLWVRPTTTENAAFATALVHHTVSQLLEKGISEPDMKRTVQFAQRYFSLYFQSQSRRVGFAVDDVFYNLRQPFLTRVQSAWATMTPAQFNAALRRHLSMDTATIGIVSNSPEVIRTSFGLPLKAPRYPADATASTVQEDAAVVTHSLSIQPSAIQVVSSQNLF